MLCLMYLYVFLCSLRFWVKAMFVSTAGTTYRFVSHEFTTGFYCVRVAACFFSV